MTNKWKKLHDVVRDTEDSGSRRRPGRRRVQREESDEEEYPVDEETAVEKEKAQERSFDSFYLDIMGKDGDNKLLDQCRSMAESVSNTFQFCEPGSFNSLEEVFSKLYQVAAVVISSAYKQQSDAINNYQTVKSKYEELLSRHRAAVKSHLEEITRAYEESGRQKTFDSSEYEIHDVSLYDELNLQDDDNRDLCLSVINIRLRELLRSPTRYLRDLIMSLFPPGEGPDWVKGGCSMEELDEERERANFLDNKLKLANARIAELAADIERGEQVREESESEEEKPERDAGDTGAMTQDMLDEIERLSRECAALEARVQTQEDELNIKNEQLVEFETRLLTAQTELEMVVEKANEAAAAPDQSGEVATLTGELDSAQNELKAEIGRHAETKKELKNLRKQFAASAKQVRTLEEQYASVVAELEDEKSKRLQMMAQMRSTENALQQLQKKLKMIGSKDGVVIDIDVDEVHRPWMSVFDRLFKDAGEKCERLEKLRETSRVNVMSGLLEVVNNIWPQFPPVEVRCAPPPPTFTISSDMAKFLTVSKKDRSPRVTASCLAKNNSSKPVCHANELKVFPDGSPKAMRKSATAPKGIKTQTPVIYKLDAIDLVARETWKDKCRRKHHESHGPTVQCPDCSTVAPALSIGWCLPPLDNAHT